MTVTGLLAITLPVIVPFGRAVGVGDTVEVNVRVGVAVLTGVVCVAVGVVDSTGVSDVGVAV